MGRTPGGTLGRRPIGAWTAAVVAAVGGAAVVARARARAVARAGEGAEGAEQGRWHVVTVGRPRAELMPDGRLPPPLDGLGDGVEIRAADAPGGRGTEIAARRTGARGPAERFRSVTGTSTDQRIRAALREFEQLTETGEVPRTAGQRAASRKPGGIPPDRAGDRARREGLL
ncbi:hypothetical protein [Streptomyces sp. S.PB5]|uniref:hypothetical protein n=1 Tax=Streptomyces sp. S.PB5 TaxID=3020844 RepID=UPI0025B190CF|nr:hypothetical protein [Streptomyces sp. S.PB5]MDN3026948.1 hypothetical protein [Streptomyces sp. S.PB5]